MLKKLQIQNFKCFLNQEIGFGRITVLAGANGVGKSTVVQSLLLIHRAFEADMEGKEIIVNDKQKTFLELGNTKEILNTNAEKNPDGDFLRFKCIDENERFVEIPLRISSNQLLNLDADLPLGENSLPFQNKALLSFLYLNAERLGPRNIQEAKELGAFNTTVGYQGELTGYAISQYSKSGRKIPENKHFIDSYLKEATIELQIKAWMNYLIPDIQIEVKPYEEINQVRIGLRKKSAETAFLHPNNIGFGISYVLPIVVAGLIADEGSMLIVENPEAHLHPSGQSRIGQFLAKMAGAGVQVVVETHSEHVVNGIRLASLKEWLNYKDVVVNFFSQEKGEVKVEKIELNELSDLKRWPVGFFDQAQRDVLEIMQLKKSKKQ
jgi:predicted ATPase